MVKYKLIGSLDNLNWLRDYPISTAISHSYIAKAARYGFPKMSYKLRNSIEPWLMPLCNMALKDSHAGAMGIIHQVQACWRQNRDKGDVNFATSVPAITGHLGSHSQQLMHLKVGRCCGGMDLSLFRSSQLIKDYIGKVCTAKLDLYFECLFDYNISLNSLQPSNATWCYTI